MTHPDARNHRALAAMHEALDDYASADLCREYADLVDATQLADSYEDTLTAATRLREFRQVWRGIREVYGSNSLVTAEAVASVPVVVPKRSWWRRG